MSSVSHLVRGWAAMLAATALAASLSWVAPAQTLDANGDPITNDAGVTFGVLSHRGGKAVWPENSVEAYTKSVAAGFDTIETDILFTTDGRPVMSHYDLLPDRCTRAGDSIHKLTWAEVSLVRCANLTGAKVVPIPTFEQLAQVLAGHSEVGLTLDIKSYSGQSAKGQRSYASRAVRLLRDNGLLPQSSILSYHWANALPTIRKYAPKTYVLALDHGKMDLDRVRLAARLGADGFGIKMKYTPASLARYVRAKGMDSVPWEVIGTERRAFTIHFGGKTQLFSSDDPAKTKADLIAGRIDLNPAPKPTLTTLATRVTVSKATYRANRRQYPLVLGRAVPSAAVAMLDKVTLAITVSRGPGKGSLNVGASSSPLSSGVKVALPKGTKTLTVTAPIGDGGKLRIYTSKTVKLTVKVVGYTRIRFA